MTTPLAVPIALRVHTVAEGDRKPRTSHRPLRWRKRKVGHRLLAITTDDEERGAQPLTVGMLRVSARQLDGSYGWAEPLRLTEPTRGVILGDALTRRERAAVIAWVERHNLRVLTVQEFIHEVFLLESYGKEGTLSTAWDWGVLLSSLATAWAPSARSQDAFTYTLCPLHKRRRTKRSHNPSAHPGCPQVRLRRLTEPYVQSVEFTRPRTQKRWGVPHFPGRFLGLHEKACVLSAEDHSLASACRMLGVAPPPEPASSSVKDRLDALALRLDIAVQLAAAVQRELLRHELIISDANEVNQ